jgi:hypothetical protein
VMGMREEKSGAKIREWLDTFDVGYGMLEEKIRNMGEEALQGQGSALRESCEGMKAEILAIARKIDRDAVKEFEAGSLSGDDPEDLAVERARERAGGDSWGESIEEWVDEEQTSSDGQELEAGEQMRFVGLELEDEDEGTREPKGDDLLWE